MTAAIAEMTHGFKRNGIKQFYVEAIVGATNEASKRAAASVVSGKPKKVTDKFSGDESYQYLRLVKTGR